MKYPHLFAPLEVAGTLFRNRLLSSPQGYYNLGPDLFPNDDMVAYFEIKARGGFASVCIGDCIVDWKNGRHYDWLLPMDNPKMLPGLSKVANAISRHGAVAAAELSTPAYMHKHLILPVQSFTVLWLPLINMEKSKKCRRK